MVSDLVNLERIIPLNLSQVKRLYDHREIVLNEAVTLVNNWRYNDMWLCFKREDLSTKKVDYVYSKASKRGNDVYRWRVKNRHKVILDFCEENSDINYVISDDDLGFSSSVLKFTLTADPKRFNLRDFNRSECSYYLDLFIKRLRNKYHLVLVSPARSFEVSENGYLHVNVIVYFPKMKFPIYLHKSKKTKDNYSWRLRDYPLKNEISAMWECGFVDIRAVSDTHDLLEYCLKYHIKYFNKPEYKKKQSFTLSVLSLYNKRSISIPDKFVKPIISYSCSLKGFVDYRLDKYMHNSLNSDVKNYAFSFICIKNEFDIDFKPDLWHFVDSRPPDLVDLDLCFNVYSDMFEFIPSPELLVCDDGWRHPLNSSSLRITKCPKHRLLGNSLRYRHLREQYEH